MATVSNAKHMLFKLALSMRSLKNLQTLPRGHGSNHNQTVPPMLFGLIPFDFTRLEPWNNGKKKENLDTH